MNDTENKNEKPLDLNTTDLIRQEHQTCNDNIRFYGKMHWEVNFIIMTAVLAGSLLIFREGISTGIEIYKYLFAIIIINTWLSWTMLFIHLYFMRLVRVENKYLKSLEENLRKNDWNGLNRFSMGEELYKDDRFLVFSEKTRMSIGFLFAYLSTFFSFILWLSIIILIVSNWQFTLQMPTKPFEYVIIFGIFTAIISIFPLYPTIKQIKHFWGEVKKSSVPSRELDEGQGPAQGRNG